MDRDTLRKSCLALKGVQEEIKWEHDLVYTVGGKMFCVTGLEGPVDFSCKVPDEEFDELCAVPGIEPAPYLARAKWVLVTEACTWKAAQKLELATRSYRLVGAKLTKKLRTEIGL